MRKHLAPVALVAVLTALLSLPQLPVPPGRDQGIFLYHGRGLIEGMVPYRDMWDHKTPGIYALYAAALALFGDRYEAVNLFDLLWRVATALALYALASRWSGRTAAVVTGLAYGGWAATTGSWFWFTAQPEGFMVLPLTLALLLQGSRRRDAQLAAGAAVACAGCLKPTAALFYPVLFAAEYLEARASGDYRRALVRISTVLLGSAFVTAAVLLAFLGSGAFPDMWQAVVEFNRLHATRAMPSAWLYRQLATLCLPFAPALLLAGLAASRLRHPDERARARAILLAGGWLLAALAMLVVQRKYFGYHYFVLGGPLALLAGQGVAWALSEARARQPRAVRYAAVTLATLFAIGFGRWLERSFVTTQLRSYHTLAYATGQLPRAEYLAGFRQADVDLGQTIATADYIGANSGSADTVLVWGFEPLVNYFAQRWAPTRFDFDLPLVVAPRSERAIALRSAWRAELLASLAEAPPLFVVLLHRDENHLEPEDSVTQLRAFPELARWVSAHYEHAATFGDFALYRRRLPPGGG